MFAERACRDRRHPAERNVGDSCETFGHADRARARAGAGSPRRPDPQRLGELRFLRVDDQRRVALRDHFLVDHDFLDRRSGDGTSYMMSSIACSRMARRPRAPRCGSSASFATAESAVFVNFSFTPSISKSFWNCFTSAFFGFVRMSMSASSFSSWSVAMTGRRPMNSGMRPNLRRSSGCTC